ncbi:uncharacterized protein BO80DRAFT_255742 [Aspergillus ibericus CBS 121593]|uniref:Uncharacterized protein n=1 Tax=Aspergillus ibericus CBS 121593 TaxID=1448316 RepID=A0A395H846_9EURO|nr:hypothetical protein BO80DRAFT_255742 [Aspergillus ibericus CBS 121593]RAL04092.1 hypothetical protein BO80DRAFT_255742 [Aspergillus ibericus CBS 121593]
MPMVMHYSGRSPCANRIIAVASNLLTNQCIASAASGIPRTTTMTAWVGTQGGGHWKPLVRMRHTWIPGIRTLHGRVGSSSIALAVVDSSASSQFSSSIKSSNRQGCDTSLVVVGKATTHAGAHPPKRERWTAVTGLMHEKYLHRRLGTPPRGTRELR